MSGKSEAGELVARILFFFVGVILLVISLPVRAILDAQRESAQVKRRDAMALKAKELGLKFRNKVTGYAGRFLFLDKLDYLNSGSDHHSMNILSGEFDGQPVTAFDYYYIVKGGVWWWAPSWVTHHYLSFIVLNLDAKFPELTIGAEGRGLFNKIREVFGGGDIDFDSHEFSKRFEVRSESKKFAYDFCNAQMMTYLLEQPVVEIEVDRDVLALGFDDQHHAPNIESHLRYLVKIRSLMPDYLFEDSQS